MGIAKKEIISWILIAAFLVLISIRPALVIIKNSHSFFSRVYEGDYEYLKKTYYSSQYVKKDKPNIMPDQAFEAFLGGAFIKGGNPIMFVHEHPPLGRYIIGFSILLFDNSTTILIPLMFFSILGTFLISKIIIKNIFLSLIPVGIFLNEPLFMSKLEVNPLIEPIQLTFIIFSLYFFIKGITGEKYSRYFILTSIMLGFVISIRFFILGGALSFAMILYFLLKKKIDKRFIIFVLSLPLSLVVLVASYTKTIQEGYSIFQIFGVQKYIFFYHKSKLSSLFSFWDLIMFNRWHTWWGDRRILSDSQWVLFWPIGMIFTFIHTLSALIKKVSLTEPEKILLLWIFCYSALLSVGYSTTRYFLPLVPFLYIMSVSFFVKIYKRDQ